MDFEVTSMDDHSVFGAVLYQLKFSEAIKQECSSKETIKLNKKWNRDYKKQGYKFMTRENIFKTVCKLIK